MSGLPCWNLFCQLWCQRGASQARLLGEPADAPGARSPVQKHFQGRKGPWHQPGLPVSTGYMCQASGPQISGTIFISQPIPSFGRQGRGGPESGRSHSKAMAEGLPAHAASHSRHFPRFKVMHPTGEPRHLPHHPPGPAGDWYQVLQLSTNHVFTCCIHLSILARAMVPGVWQELRETWSTKSRLRGETTGGRLHVWPKHWGGGWESRN